MISLEDQPVLLLQPTSQNSGIQSSTYQYSLYTLSNWSVLSKETCDGTPWVIDWLIHQLADLGRPVYQAYELGCLEVLNQAD